MSREAICLRHECAGLALAANQRMPCAAPSFISAVPALPQRRCFTWLITAGMTMITAATIGGVGANARATKCARGSATTKRSGAAATTSGTIATRDGGDRSWRDRGDASYERTSGASGWRGGRDLGGYEGSRYGSNWGESRGSNYRPDHSRGDENERYGWGRGSPDYDRGSHDSSRGDWGRGYSGRDDRQQYGRGGQYGSSSYDRGQLRRHFSDWTPGGASGWRDWENRESSGTGYRSGSDWGSTTGWGRESYAGRGPKGYRRSDERIREEVSDALTADPLVDASEITVQVENGHVTLIGTVAARDQKRRAEDCAERVSGVDDVTNNLRVNKQDYTKGDERQDASHIVTPSVVTPEGRNR